MDVETLMVAKKYTKGVVAGLMTEVDVILRYNTSDEFAVRSIAPGEIFYIEVSRLFFNVIRVVGISGDSEYPVYVKNLNTGAITKEICHNGIYQIDVQAFSTLKFYRTTSSQIGNQLSLVERIKNLIPPVEVGYTLTSSVSLTSSATAISLGNYRLLNILEQEGDSFLISSAYGVDENAHIYKSQSTWATDDTIIWTDLGTMGTSASFKSLPVYLEWLYDSYGAITGAFAVMQGKIVCRCTDISGDVWTWTFINAISLPEPCSPAYAMINSPFVGGCFQQLKTHWDKSTGKTLILLSEYIQPTSEAYLTDISAVPGAGRLYLCTDGLASPAVFTAIFDIANNNVLPEVPSYGSPRRQNHIHCCDYDPYDELIWITLGDGIGNACNLYSPDLGVNWYAEVPVGEGSIQNTAFAILPNCVLFGSDAPVVGMSRYNRPSCGITPGRKVHLDFPFKIYQCSPSESGIPDMSRPAVNHKKGHAMFGYFLSESSYNNLSVSGKAKLGSLPLFLTDGYKFYNVYTHGNYINNGVTGCWYDAVTDRYVARLGSSYEGAESTIVIVNPY